MSNPIRVDAPAAPGSGETVVLADSTKTFGGAGLQASGIRGLLLSFPGLDQAGADNGLKLYTSPDGGAHWYQKAFTAPDGTGGFPKTVAADDGTDSQSFNVYIATERDVKAEFTAGVTPPEVWAPSISWDPDPTPATDAQAVPLSVGYKNIRTLTFSAPAGYADDQTLTIFDLTFVIHKTAGWGGVTGEQVELDISGAADAQDVGDAFKSANNADEGTTHVAGDASAAGVVTCTAKTEGAAYNAAGSGTAACTEATVQLGADPIIHAGNQNLALSNKGDMPIGQGSGKPAAVEAAGADGEWLVYDSTKATGVRKESFATRSAFEEPANLAIDWATKKNKVFTLANGANAITGLLNGTPGVVHLLKLIQPSSGAAGTITVEATAPEVVHPVAGALSTTNGAHNFVTFVKDSTTDPEAPAWSVIIGAEVLPQT